MRKKKSNNGNLPLKIMSDKHILSQYIYINHGPYCNIKGIDNIYRKSETYNDILIDKKLSDKSFCSSNYKNFICSKFNSIELMNKGLERYNKYLDNMRNKHNIIYCNNIDNRSRLLKSSLEYIRNISKNNIHLEKLDKQLNSLALCEEKLDDKRKEFRKLVYGTIDKYSIDDDFMENKDDSISLNENKRTYKYPLDFSIDEVNKAKDYLYKTKNMGLVIAINKRSNIELDISLIQCLKPQQWLNDELINFYFSMLQERNERELSKGKHKVWFWNTFFYSKLVTTRNNEIEYCYKNVSRWTLRKKIDLFNYDLILIPINVNNVHWTLGVVNLKKGYIQYLDSLGGLFQNHSGYLKMSISFYENINRYIQDEYFDKKKDKYPGKLEHFTNFQDPVPQQNNGSDCGVFTCMFAECISDDRPFDFNVNDVDNIRINMLIECIRNSVK